MRIISISLFITILTAAGLPPAFAAESPATTPAAKPGLAWGAADVQPTPENPVYFRWTLGHFPGAQPPLEFLDGTPVQVDVEVKGKKTKIWDFADTKSKNIQWKARVPGWGLSHPIVVGKRVFGVNHPDFVTCWDLETGKQLWQRRIMPLLCDGLTPLLPPVLAPSAKVISYQYSTSWVWGLVSVGSVRLLGELERGKPGGFGLAPSSIRTTTRVAACRLRPNWRLAPHQRQWYAAADG